MSNLIVKMQFGSHVYGTNTPESDQDFKAVFVPPARDILLQLAKRNISTNTKQDPTAKNTAQDVDFEQFSLHEFIRLLLDAQTVALDMLFTPQEFLTDRYSEGIWGDLVKNRHRFLHRGVSSFVGYTQKQAAKYGVKGSRVAAARLAAEFIQALPVQNVKLSMHETSVREMVEQYQKNLPAETESYINIVQKMGKNPAVGLETFLEVCNRKIPFHAITKFAASQCQDLVDRYGQRALAAETNLGVDWKALMHAVRVSHEAYELLTTGHITFPRPERELLLKIRKREIEYKKVAELIEEGLDKVEAAQETSSLPDKPDVKFAEDFSCEHYYRHIVRDLSKVYPS